MVAQHNKLMLASGYTVLGLFGLPVYRRAEAAAEERRVDWLERVRLIEYADAPPATCRTARSGGWRSRAPCAPSPSCSASTSRPPASTRGNRPT